MSTYQPQQNHNSKVMLFITLIAFALAVMQLCSSCNRKASTAKSSYDSTSVAKYDSSSKALTDSTGEKTDKQVKEEESGFKIKFFGNELKGVLGIWSDTIKSTAVAAPYVVEVFDSAGVLKIVSNQPIASITGNRKKRAETSQHDSTGLKKQQTGNLSTEQKTSVKAKEKAKETEVSNSNLWKFLSLIGFLLIVALFIIIYRKVK